jgi:hypothetical protein
MICWTGSKYKAGVICNRAFIVYLGSAFTWIVAVIWHDHLIVLGIKNWVANALIPRTLFRLWCIHGSELADGTDLCSHYWHLNLLIIKPNRCTNFSNSFWKETLHVLDSSSVCLQEFFTVHTAMVYVIQVCWQLANGNTMEHSPILFLYLVGFIIRNLSQCTLTWTSNLTLKHLSLPSTKACILARRNQCYV